MYQPFPGVEDDMLQVLPVAADEADALVQGWGESAFAIAQERLHAAMVKRHQPMIDHAISVCRLLIVRRRGAAS